jgi:outer membrane lipoprotein-sorting protein
MLNPMMGQTAPEALPAEQAKAGQSQLQIGGPLFDYAAKGNKVELVGKEDVNGVSAYKIKVTTKDSIESTYDIDPNTYYILKAVNTSKTPGQEGETSVTFSNYQKTDFGYVFPMAQQITLPQGITLSITHKKIEINKDIDMKVFDMPKS